MKNHAYEIFVFYYAKLWTFLCFCVNREYFQNIFREKNYKYEMYQKSENRAWWVGNIKNFMNGNKHQNFHLKFLGQFIQKFYVKILHSLTHDPKNLHFSQNNIHPLASPPHKSTNNKKKTQQNQKKNPWCQKRNLLCTNKFMANTANLTKLLLCKVFEFLHPGTSKKGSI